ncbi:MAG: OsmC family protein [Bdellovibrionota bacterium]
MVRSKTIYQGDKHCDLTHEPSGAHISTDAPKDNHGKGEAFSPTDLLGAALASCVLTTMAIQTEPEGFNIKGAYATTEKHMTPPPRRVASLNMEVYLPQNLTAEQRTRLEEIANNCPVYRSLHPDVKMPMQFHYVV